MAHDREQLREMLAEADAMAYGHARNVLTADIVRHADAQGFDDLSFAARMALTRAYEFSGESAKSFVPFSWCLAAYDRDPGRFDGLDYPNLLWQFKWIVNALPNFPEVSLRQTSRTLDDMERRYRDAGYSLQAVYARRCRVAGHVGDAAAAEWYRRWCTTPRDVMSDCEACDIASRIAYLLDRDPDPDAGHDAEVAAAAEPVIAGGLGCELQPQSLYAELMLPYLRLGDVDAARDAHRWYRKIRDNPNYLASVGRHLEFCALTGNEARGLEILERHLGWFDRQPDMDLLEGAGGAALLLRRLYDIGRGDVTVRRPAHRDRPAATVAVAALADEVTATAHDLAARFDARNGTDRQSQLLQRRLTAEPLVDQLPLTATARRRAAPPQVAELPPAAPDDLADATPAELLDLGEKRFAEHQIATALAAWHRYDEVAGVDVDPPLAARRIDARGLQAALADDHAAAEAHWRDAAERYATLGDEVRRHAVLGRLGQLLCLTERVDDGFPLVTASADYLRIHGSDTLRCGAELRLGHVQHATGDLDAAGATLDRAEAVAANAAQRGSVYLERALLLAHRGDRQQAVAAATAAREEFRAAGTRDRLGQASFMHAKLLEESDSDAAIAAYDEAVVHSAADQPVVAASVRASRGVLLTGAGRHDEAIDDLIEAVAIFTEQGAAGNAAYTRFDLAIAYRDADRLFEAAEVAEEAVAALADTDDTETTERCRYLLTHLYRGLAEHDQALVQLDLLAAAFTTTDRLPAAAQMHEEAGEVLDARDRDAAAAARFGTAASMFADTGQVSDEVRCRRRQALALHWAGESADGLTTLTAASATLDGLPDDVPPAAVAWERAANDYTAARILLHLRRHDEASAHAAKAVSGFQEADATDDTSRAAALVTDIDEARQTADREQDSGP